jgi:prepilin-type N-terminal cleavage/methylation domain-containing protein
MSAPRRGLTLLEVMVTLTIFLVLALLLFAMVRDVVASWTQGERRRVLYEKAAGVVNIMSDDLRLALSHESPGATDVKVRFISDFEPSTNNQQLVFVRSFEYGPERAITFNAADGMTNDLMFQASIDPDDPRPTPRPVPKPGTPNKGGAADNDSFDGLRVGDFKALGGMAAVAYFVKNETLYRAVRAPVPQALSSMFVPAKSQIVATDVLYFELEYWSQKTESWDEIAGKPSGPQKIWDSTRGITGFPLERFFLHRDPITLNDPEDDVFPQKVRVTVTIDSSMPRCIFTKLSDETGEGDLTLYAEGTRGFPDGGDDSYIKIDNEWMQLKKRSDDQFVITRRGVRGTKATGHNAGAIVRAGKTFQRVIFIPNFREDNTPDELYYARKGASNKVKRILK